MNARDKLNQAYAYGSLILATFIGLVFNSWVAFGIAAGVLLGLNLMGGDIRLGGGAHMAGGRIRMAGARQR